MRQTKRETFFMISALLAAVAIIILHNIHDYLEYEKHWINFLEGSNPWFSGSSNAYGPLHNIVGFFYYFYPKLPRIIFSASAILTSMFLYRLAEKNNCISQSDKKNIFLLLILNPIIWVFVVVYGSNDGLVSSMTLFALYFYDKKRYFLSAVLISLAILYKYMPLFILPVLFVNERHIKWRFAIFTMLFVAIGFGLTYLTWGNSIMGMLKYTASRESKILSIYRYFRGDYSFLQVFGISNIDHLSTYSLVASVFSIFFLQLFLAWNHLKAIVVSLLFVYLFYKIGHFQFYLTIYFVLIYYMSKSEKTTDSLFTKNKIMFFLLWVACITILYAATEGFYDKFEFIRDLIGLPNAIILIYLINSFFKKQHATMSTIK